MKKQNILTGDRLFEKPTERDCRLIKNDECSGVSGCPLHPGSSCSHGIEGQECAYGIKSLLPRFEYRETVNCQLIASNICTSSTGCPLHPGHACSHGLEGYVCEYGINL